MSTQVPHYTEKPSSSNGHTHHSIDDTIGSILPSYSMFTNTIRMNATVPENDEDNNITPPNYTIISTQMFDQSSSISSNTSQIQQLSLTGSTSTRATNEDSDFENAPFIIADENTGTWQETILDNVHRLPNLTFESHKISEAVKLAISFTKDICEIGKVPELIDPSVFEYKQGDLLNGYITIKNTSERPIPFEMFYLLFEGNFMIANPNDRKSRVPVK
ncbi:BUL1, partial [[Candida] subhashii]